MAEETRPNWDLTPYFPAFRGVDYTDFRTKLATDVAAIRQALRKLGKVEVTSLEAWAVLLEKIEDAQARSEHLGSYLGWPVRRTRATRAFSLR